ncbi:MAG: threonine/serine dehydratase [Chlamydiota bacterium]
MKDVELSGLREAYLKILPYILRTPLLRCPAIEKKLSTPCRIFLKLENTQITKSFKARGAFHALLCLSKEQRKRGVVSRSAGNFAQALAFAAKILNIPATLVMSENVSLLKKELTAQHGAKIVLAGTTHKEGNAKVAELAEKYNLCTLSPYDHFDVIVGQGTLALEIFDDLPTIEHFFSPIGGGGLLSGCSAAFKKLKPTIKIHGVEPEGANDYFQSRQTCKNISIEFPTTIADGLRANEVGILNRPLLDKYVDTVSTVSDSQIIQAMRFIKEELDMMIEPSGVAALASILYGKQQLHGDVVCVLTGGNIDTDSYLKLMA